MPFPLPIRSDRNQAKRCVRLSQEIDADRADRFAVKPQQMGKIQLLELVGIVRVVGLAGQIPLKYRDPPDVVIGDPFRIGGRSSEFVAHAPIRRAMRSLCQVASPNMTSSALARFK